MALHHRLIGGAARLYWRVRRPRTLGVRAVLIDQHGRVALVRHTDGDKWYLPGGGVKKGEGFDAALFRELAEEVAVADGAIERIVGVYHNLREGKDDHVVIFAVRVAADRGDELPCADPSEIAEARWFPLDRIPSAASKATRRRIAEYRSDKVGSGAW